MSTFNSWILPKSIETLAVRLDRHCENALSFAKYFENHTKIKTLKYPFLASHPQYKIAKKQMLKGGNIVTMELKGGIESGKTVLNQIQMCSLSANLGDIRTKPMATLKQLNLIPHRFHLDLPQELINEVQKASDNSTVSEIGIEWCIEQS